MDDPEDGLIRAWTLPDGRICEGHGWLGKFHHDLTWRPKPIDDGECKGNFPQMAEIFRLVNYSNFPRLIVVDSDLW